MVDRDQIKLFVNHNVEVLVGGVWIEGHMTPIVKDQVTLLAIGEAAAFYGPTALKLESIVAIRQVKKVAPQPHVDEVKEKAIKSSLDKQTVGKFVIAR
jgi:hypothetical protein